MNTIGKIIIYSIYHASTKQWQGKLGIISCIINAVPFLKKAAVVVVVVHWLSIVSIVDQPLQCFSA